MKKYMTVEMPDSSVWAVPTEMIARNHAAHYAHQFGNDINKSLQEGTIPLFEADESEIEDWAINNMDWADFYGHQIRVSSPDSVDYQAGWIDGEKAFTDEAIRYKERKPQKEADS